MPEVKTTTGIASPVIMIVDDTPANLDLLSGMLKDQGYRTRPLVSGVQALKVAAKFPPDLILLDINMPEMDGYEVCLALKADPALADIPVLFISARTETEDKVRGFKVGGVDFISKPFQFEEVEARVRAHLQIQGQKRELRESYDKLRHLEETRDSLVHMVVHDMRGLLHGITCSLELMEVSQLPTQAADMLKISLTSAQRLGDLINCILDVNKMESGQIELSPCTFNLTDMAKEVAERLQSLKGNRNLNVLGGPCEVTGDIYLLSRVVQNLLGNALKFTPPTGTVCILVESRDEGAKLSVIDNGLGIPPEHKERIFDKFVQVGSVVTRGTGLGLTFCRLAITAHGGRIGVESALGGGATFWFTLPRVVAPNE